MIHDAQYTLEEYPSKLTWGHSPAELAVDFALAAGVKRLALFHHDPLRDDAALDRLVEACSGALLPAGSMSLLPPRVRRSSWRSGRPSRRAMRGNRKLPLPKVLEPPQRPSCSLTTTQTSCVF